MRSLFDGKGYLTGYQDLAQMFAQIQKHFKNNPNIEIVKEFSDLDRLKTGTLTE